MCAKVVPWKEETMLVGAFFIALILFVANTARDGVANDKSQGNPKVCALSVSLKAPVMQGHWANRRHGFNNSFKMTPCELITMDLQLKCRPEPPHLTPPSPHTHTHTAYASL